MCTRVPSVGDVIRVKPGVTAGDRCLGGMHLTVVGVHAVVEVDATEWTGGAAIHLLASNVDIVSSRGVS